jgi:hypothetical protein
MSQSQSDLPVLQLAPTMQPGNLTTEQRDISTTLQPGNLATCLPCNLATLQPSNVTSLQPCNLAIWQPCNLATLRPCSLASQDEHIACIRKRAHTTSAQRRLMACACRTSPTTGPGGPVGVGMGPPCPSGNRAWVDDCSLQNAAVVRNLLERHSGLVLATFSGHDHVPKPPYTKVCGVTVTTRYVFPSARTIYMLVLMLVLVLVLVLV